jgi:hypothetical protein
MVKRIGALSPLSAQIGFVRMQPIKEYEVMRKKINITQGDGV